MKTLIELRQMAEYVRSVSGDPEKAHGNEDLLMVCALEAIRAGIEHPEEAAAIGLSTQELDFDRWYA